MLNRIIEISPDLHRTIDEIVKSEQESIKIMNSYHYKKILELKIKQLKIKNLN